MAVPHYAYLKLKMPGSAGVLTINRSFIKSDQCDRDFHKISDTLGAEQELKEIAMGTDKSTFPLASRSESREYGRDFSIDSDTVTHQVHPTDPDKTVRVYAHLPEEQAAALVAFLRDEWEIFAWCPANMPGIPREFAEHALCIKPNTKLVKQALRRFSEPKRRAIGEEVNRLLDAQFIRETKKATWIANPVLVPKKDMDVLRMCVDYGPVNKHCPKDYFPLPRIDQIIDSTAGYDLLSFLDAYSGYNQIRMKEEDEEHTSFITPYDVFCYRTMPFGLKNAGATYQRMMQACLRHQIGRNVQVYVDDVVIKTYSPNTLRGALRETFATLNKYRIKLNPKKCVFGVPAGKLLGYMVSARGIEANPEKVQAIAKMQEPTNIKGVQQLTVRLAALSRFIGRLGERTLPFYQLLGKGEKFEWTEEARKAFVDLKKTLSTPPILAVPKEREKLYLYIAARSSVVSTTLVVERTEEGKVQSIQRPIYYLSMLLTKSQQRYPHYQKLQLAVIMTSRKVSHYFDKHPITIVSSAPLADILNNPGATGRVTEWNIELSPRDLQFKHPTTIKSQVLPDFLVEWTEVQTPGPPRTCRT